MTTNNQISLSDLYKKCYISSPSFEHNIRQQDIRLRHALVKEQGWGGLITDSYGLESLDCLDDLESAKHVVAAVNIPFSGLSTDQCGLIVRDLWESYPDIQSFLLPLRTILVRGGHMSEIREEVQYFNHLGEQIDTPITLVIDVGAITKDEDLGSILSIINTASFVNPGITVLKSYPDSSYKTLQRVLEGVYNAKTTDAFFFGTLPTKFETISAILHAGFTKISVSLSVAQWLLRVPFNE